MIRILSEDDREMILDYLERNEIETAFLYINITECGIENKKDLRRCADYFGYFENGILKGILPFYNLGSCIPHFESEGAIPLFAGIMRDRSFKFLMGMERYVDPLHQAVKDCKETAECSEDSYCINRDFKPYIDDELVFIDPSKVPEDDGIVEFIMRVRKNGFHETVSGDDVRHSIRNAGPEGDKVIAVKDGKMVAYALIQAYTKSLNQIGSVYTVEDERGRGYCKAVVSEVCRRIVARNKIPTLFVRKNNTPAVRAYSSLGFAHYDDYMLVRFN